MPTSRLASHIHQALVTGCRVAIIGLPDDLGVRLNGGRPGAAEGPRAFRAALSRYGVAQPQGFSWPGIFDAGDVEPAAGHGESALLETHARIEEATKAVLELGLFPVAIGGGHDLTLPFVRAVKRHAGAGVFGGVYFDAHLDVRENVGSGMPFRRLMEEGCGPVLNVGYDALANSAEHVGWFLEHGGELADEDWAGTLDEADEPELGASFMSPLEGAEKLFCSFDMDALDASSAPGVSAMNPCGMSVRDARRGLFVVCSDPRLACLDFMELSPAQDGSGRTARVAAHLFLHALMGLRLGPLMHEAR